MEFHQSFLCQGVAYMTYSQSYKSQRWFRDYSEALQGVKERACVHDLSSVWECFCVCVCARYLLVRQLEFLPVLKAITKVNYDFYWCANIFWRVVAFAGVCMSCWEGYTVPCNFRLIIRDLRGDVHWRYSKEFITMSKEARKFGAQDVFQEWSHGNLRFN